MTSRSKDGSSDSRDAAIAVLAALALGAAVRAWSRLTACPVSTANVRPGTPSTLSSCSKAAPTFRPLPSGNSSIHSARCAARPLLVARPTLPLLAAGGDVNLPRRRLASPYLRGLSAGHDDCAAALRRAARRRADENGYVRVRRRSLRCWRWARRFATGPFSRPSPDGGDGRASDHLFLAPIAAPGCLTAASLRGTRAQWRVVIRSLLAIGSVAGLAGGVTAQRMAHSGLLGLRSRPWARGSCPRPAGSTRLGFLRLFSGVTAGTTISAVK